ncbi:transaldolase [Moraxella nasovis]|uniref:transaldolase n=1 Tax=Moraxella nasovis TaxID=2904121 RepID=UPI001F619AC1|nr:transaldolase [Moraxella nasovis]UNU72515.1 transaldolase [Moraxella nasovis]
MTTLAQLQAMTTIVADTGNLDAIERLKPIDATTNPSLITQVLSLPEFEPILKDSLNKHPHDIDKVIDDLTVFIGTEILKRIDGKVSTEVDARLSFDTKATVKKALEFIKAYEEQGICKDRVLIKIASTWQGIQAGRQLEKQGIHCNLTLLFGLHQAYACADAGITLISPFVGRILDWQKRHENRETIPVTEDKGVLSVKAIYQYFKQHDYRTQIMGASFRNTDEILALAGCDLLTISPDLIDKLAKMDVAVTRQLSPNDGSDLPKQILTKDAFDEQLQNDAMSTELLTNGIDGFIKAREALADRLRSLAH